MSYQAITNAKIVTSKEIVEGAIVFGEDGRIAETGANVDWTRYAVDQVYDAGGAYVLPGGIDAHVHLGGFGEIAIADDFYHGTCAALAGGTTTVMDFCEPARGVEPLTCIRKRKEEAKHAVADYAFHFVLTEDYRKQLEQIERIEAEGIRDFKLFTTYENTTLGLDDICNIFSFFRERAGKTGRSYTFLVHAEDDALISENIRKNSNQKEMIYLAETRPVEAERKAVREIRELAVRFGVQVCIAHVSAGSIAEECSEGEAGDVFRETCPHYLEFDENRLLGKQAALYTMIPPLRRDEERQILWEKVKDGTVSMLSTDHCPYRFRDKMGKTYRTVPCGVDGIQTRMIYLYSEGVVRRGLSMKDYVRLTSENAARFYHLYPQKGALFAGSDADLVILSPDGSTTCSVRNSFGAIDYSIYEGKKLNGSIVAVFKNGKRVYDKDGLHVIAEQGNDLKK